MNNNISMYQMLFLLCLSLSILFLGMALYIFIKQNIPATLGYLTGRNERKMVREMEQISKHTDHYTNRKFRIIKEIVLLPTEELIEEGGM